MTEPLMSAGIVQRSAGISGMPEKLKEYWLHGIGAAKIGWGIPHDFYRCVSLLTKYYPRDPKGLCALLHHERLAAWPGREHFAIDDAGALVASAHPSLDTTRPMRWMGPLARLDSPTDDPSRRIIDSNGFSHRELPLPLAFQVHHNGVPHGDSVTVGRIAHLDYSGEHVIGAGDVFTSDVVPEVARMAALAQGGVIGASLDGGNVEAHYDQESASPRFTRYQMAGATMVPRPAFADQRILIWNDDSATPTYSPTEDELRQAPGYASLLASAPAAWIDPSPFTVLADGWQSMPIAPRQAKWDADEAADRITGWAAGNAGKLAQVFLWRDPARPATDSASYRLPIADIIGGRPVMFYHAVYAAAALLSGGHGGLPSINDAERARLKSVVTDIYAKLSEAFTRDSGSPVHIAAPWDRKPTGPQTGRIGVGQGDKMETDVDTDTDASFGVNSHGWSTMPIAEDSRVWDASAAVARIAAATGVKGEAPNWSKFGRAFLWHAENPKAMGDFKLPIVDIIDGTWTVVPRAVNSVASVLGGGRGGVDIPAADQGALKSVVAMLRKRIQGRAGSMTVTAAGVPLAPPASWFEDPQLSGPTRLQVTPEGHVFGHLADWKTCHLSFQRTCVMAPHSKTGYTEFHVAQVLTDEGDMIDVGKVTANTGHAELNLTAASTRAHYDNTGTEAAIVRAGEDSHGIWVAGAMVPEAGPDKMAALRRSPLSGDWRGVGGNLELVAALCVNRPGFAIKPAFSAEDEQMSAMVAVGMIMAEDIVDPDVQLAEDMLQVAVTEPVDPTPLENAILDRLNVQRQLWRQERFAELTREG